MRITYLATNYPMVSHTFIQGEIEALESMGVEVVRIALNSPQDVDLVTRKSRAEAARTYYVKATPRLTVAATCLTAALRHPRATLEGLRRALGAGPGTPRAVVTRLLQFVEALLVWRHGEAAGSTVVHAHFAQAPATVAMFAAAFGNDVEPNRWKWGVTIHGWHEFANEDTSLLQKKLEAADLVVGISEFTKAQLMRIAPVECWPKIHVVRCGIDRHIFASRRPQPTSTPPRIVMTARLSREKGHLVLLHAVERLRSRGIETKTILIGHGPARSDIESAVADLELGDCVELTGALEQTEIAEVLRTADVFCLPSFAEGLPVSIMEAMAVGVPVVTTYISGIPELVVDQQTGWIVPAGSAPMLAEAIRDALANPRRDEIIVAAQAAVDERHILACSANSLVQLFRSYYFDETRGGSPTQTAHCTTSSGCPSS